MPPHPTVGTGAERYGIVAVLVAFAVLGGAVAVTGAESPVLAELFTSQGCSSCPPADRLLSELATQGRVIALAFHVDYWNYIGWTDPFSSARWSERQRSYAAAFGAQRIYTPQLVVGGRWEGVGSDRREVEALLARAAESRRAALELALDEAGGALTAVVRVRPLGEAIDGSVQPWLAVAESGFSTPVGRGENADHTLRNDHVVRRLEPLAEAAPLPPQGAEWRAAVALDPGWRRDRLRLVAFLQEPATGAVHGAAQSALAER